MDAKQVDYGIRKITADGVKMTLLPNTTAETARKVFNGVLELAKGQGYRVVQLGADRYIAIIPGSDTPVEWKFMRLARETEPIPELVYMAVQRALVAYGSAK